MVVNMLTHSGLEVTTREDLDVRYKLELTLDGEPGPIVLYADRFGDVMFGEAVYSAPRKNNWLQNLLRLIHDDMHPG